MSEANAAAADSRQADAWVSGTSSLAQRKACRGSWASCLSRWCSLRIF